MNRIPLGRSRRVRGLLALATALLLTVTLSGCFKIESNLTLDGDTASGYFIIALHKDSMAAMEGLGDGAGSDDLLGELDDSAPVPEGAAIEEYEDEEYEGRKYVFEGMSLAEFNSPDLRIDYDPDAGSYEVTGLIDLGQADPSGAPDGEDALLPPEAFELMMGSMVATISITFPGEVTSHNGELSGTTVVWRGDVGERTEIQATARSTGGGAVPGAGPAGNEPAGDGAPGALEPTSSSSAVSTTAAVAVALAVLVIAIAIGLGIWLLRRGGRPGDPPTEPLPTAVPPAADQR